LSLDGLQNAGAFKTSWRHDDSQNASDQPGLKPTTLNQYYTTPPYFVKKPGHFYIWLFTLCSKTVR